MKSSGSPELAAAVTTLAQATISSSELANETKNQILEILGALAEEAVAPKEKRKSAVARALIIQLSQMLAGVGALHGLWGQLKVLFEKFFGNGGVAV